VLLYRQGDKSALDKIIEQNTGIVNKIVNGYYTLGTNSIDKDDLMQEGYLGLMKAVEKYNFNDENKAQFITYAVFWIRSKISRFVNRKNTSMETSLNKPVGEDDGELGDLIESTDRSMESIAETLYLNNLRKELEEQMIKLNSLEEREVIKLKYGWTTKPMAYDEIGAILDITDKQAISINNSGLRKLGNSMWIRKKRNEFEELGYIKPIYAKGYTYTPLHLDRYGISRNI